jgi:branched-chain amino acid transport system permease protein
VTHQLLLFVAAAGLTMAVGWGGLPSLAQGAFVGLGAYGTAIAATRYHADPVTAVAAGIATSALAGAALAKATARLTKPFIALATWLAAWAFALAVGAFPSVTGGARGLILPPARLHVGVLAATYTVSDATLLLAAMAAAALTIALVTVLRPRLHPALALARDDHGAAAAAGVPVDRLRLIALTLSAALGGLAGALLVLHARVADPTAYGPLLSVELFLVVLVGGADRLTGAAAGLVLLAAVDPLARVAADVTGTRALVLEPAIAGAVLLAVVAFVPHGLVPRRHRPQPIADQPIPFFDGAALEATDIAVSFGGNHALDGVTIDVAPGACHAVIGPNGSGKTTLLRVLAGTVEPDRGSVALGGYPLPTHALERRRLGLARTLQRPLATTTLTTTDAVLAGTEPARRTGIVRAAFATPLARADQRRARGRAHQAMNLVGLSDQPVTSLDGAERRLLQLAQALAGGARVLLLDEPSAGMAEAEQDRLAHVLRSLHDAGLTLVVVEHNLRLVDGLADRVTVLDAGRVLAQGTAADVLAQPAVRAAYLGE